MIAQLCLDSKPLNYTHSIGDLHGMLSVSIRLSKSKIHMVEDSDNIEDYMLEF